MDKEEQGKTEKTQIDFGNQRFVRDLLGQHDAHMRAIETAIGVRISVSGNSLIIAGPDDPRDVASRVVTQLYDLIQTGYPVYPSDVDYAVRIISQNHTANLRDIFLDTVYVSANRRTITPKSLAQKAYIDAIRKYDIVFGIGPAGTGKCVGASSLVLTTKGLIPIERIGAETVEGQYALCGVQVSSLRGIENASHVYNGGRCSTKRVVTKRGYQIEVTHEHPLLKRTDGGNRVWERADQLRAGDYVAIQKGQQLFGNEVILPHDGLHTMPRNTGATGEAADPCEDFSFFLGLLSGERWSRLDERIIVPIADRLAEKRVKRLMPRIGLQAQVSGSEVSFSVAEFSRLFPSFQCLNCEDSNKAVPDPILNASCKIVRAFLLGISYTSGWQYYADGSVIFCSSSKLLTEQLQIVLLNLGILTQRDLSWSSAEQVLLPQLYIGQLEARLFADWLNFRLDRKGNKKALRNDVSGNSLTVGNANAGVVPSSQSPGNSWQLQRSDYREREGTESLVSESLKSLQGELVWEQVANISDEEGNVYDLTVPGSHSFCANGFINHNTYLAMAVAVAELMKKKVSRVVLTRPAVEAGEKLGFLPGDLAEKINPYLRPLYDALHDMVDFGRAQKMMERGVIEVAPLAFMRGRTLNDSFVILDEAQNTTPEQMKMFLTRLGYGSKAVITGDITQVDLPTGTRSGLREARKVLSDIADINFSLFSEKDVVRHRLVQDVISAYERAEAAQERHHDETRARRRNDLRVRARRGHLRIDGRPESTSGPTLEQDDTAASGTEKSGAESGIRHRSDDSEP